MKRKDFNPLIRPDTGIDPMSTDLQKLAHRLMN